LNQPAVYDQLVELYYTTMVFDRDRGHCPKMRQDFWQSVGTRSFYRFLKVGPSGLILMGPSYMRDLGG